MDGTEINPWCVSNLEEFMYYCCPECDKRSKSKNLFVKHALGEHSKAQTYLQKFRVKENVDNIKEFFHKSKSPYNYENSLEINHMKNENEDSSSNWKKYENEILSEEGEIDKNLFFGSDWEASYIMGKDEIISTDKLEYSVTDSKLKKCYVSLTRLKPSDINKSQNKFTRTGQNVKVPSKYENYDVLIDEIDQDLSSYASNFDKGNTENVEIWEGSNLSENTENLLEIINKNGIKSKDKHEMTSGDEVYEGVKIYKYKQIPFESDLDINCIIDKKYSKDEPKMTSESIYVCKIDTNPKDNINGNIQNKTEMSTNDHTNITKSQNENVILKGADILFFV